MTQDFGFSIGSQYFNTRRYDSDCRRLLTADFYHDARFILKTFHRHKLVAVF